MSGSTPIGPGTIPLIGPRDIDGTGVVVHPIGLDGSVFGWAAGVDETAEVLDRFRAAGGNLVCTSDHYAGGRSEVMIGSWLSRVGDRSSVVISTRVGSHPDAPGLGQRAILRAVEASLDRLGTDYIDFLALDGDHRETPIDETLEALDRLVREGKVRFPAAHGYSASRIREFDELADAAKYPAFRAILVEYSLMQRGDYEGDLQGIASRARRAALARLPLANGYLTGQYRTRDDVPSSVLFGGAVRHIGRHGSRVLEALDSVAKELGQTPGRVALAWVLVKPGIAAAVVRVSDREMLDESLAASEVRLTRHQVSRLDRASAG
jgi:aryl-alcohol dehydrogenase-like predicted oxidoreductase